MAEDYAEIATDVADEIAEEGFDCILKKLVRADEGPNGTTPDSYTSHTVKVVRGKIKERYSPDNVVTRYSTLLMGATGPVPTNADRIVVAGIEHKIEFVTPTAPAGVPVLYKIEVLA